MKLTLLAQHLALVGLCAPLLSLAQSDTAPQRIDRVEVTGSSIKRVRDEGALPVQTITAIELTRAGIVTAEQLMARITSNGNGLDNMASQSDVVSGDARGNNGASYANLRGQGSRNTLVLLNGRRMASDGLNGTAVNLNTIPMMAIERVEILKDGASAIYGTDAIGGVINFITRRDLTGFQMESFADLTDQGGGNIYRLSASGGRGNLASDGYNLMFSLAHTDNEALLGTQRPFVNTFQSNRGLSVDTRGTPTATVFDRSGLNTILGSKGAGVTMPGGSLAYNGINVLALPGGAGCQSMPNSAAYDAQLWASPGSALGCAWDTGKAATLQQPVQNTSGILRFTSLLGEHQLSMEYLGASVHSSKSFSNVQVSSSPSAPFLYPSTGASYKQVFNAIEAVFPSIAANYGKPIAFRWRCMECGARQIETTTDSMRSFVGLEGPLPFKGWDYKTGISVASSTDRSTLGGGYYYQDGLVSAISSGALDPFLMPGQQQTAAGMAALNAASARGLELYHGKFSVTQADATANGPLFQLPAGSLMAAAGVDLRRETYTFFGQNGSPSGRTVLAAPFDGSNAVSGVSRDIKAVYGELLIPVLKNLELNLAGRSDDYTGFGRTNNPKLGFRYTPVEDWMLRGSYTTGFRVPTFSQALNGPTITPYDGKDLVDPAKCPSLVVNPKDPNCQAIFPNIISGGNSLLGPETSRSGTVGLVASPIKDWMLSLDWWSITRDNTIRSPALSELMGSYQLFQDKFQRDASGALLAIDTRWINAGGAQSSGLELGLGGNGALGNGRWDLRLDGSYLLDKRLRARNDQPWGPSLLGQFNRYDDPGIRWKHVLSVGYQQGAWYGSFTQHYTGGYTDAVLPGVANGTVTPPQWSPNVKPFITYDASASYKFGKPLTVTLGIKNLFGTNPPFSAYYDANLGSGSSWDPRVADPRGRSLTANLRYEFF